MVFRNCRTGMEQCVTMIAKCENGHTNYKMGPTITACRPPLFGDRTAACSQIDERPPLFGDLDAL